MIFTYHIVINLMTSLIFSCRMKACCTVTFFLLFQEVLDACVGTSVGTITEPDCLGPCEPGTSVTLEGIVWHETEGGKQKYRQIRTECMLRTSCNDLHTTYSISKNGREWNDLSVTNSSLGRRARYFLEKVTNN